MTYRLQLYLLRREQGRLAEVADVLRASPIDYPTYPIFRAVQAQAAAELGHAEEARDALEALTRDDFAAVPFDEEWLVIMALLAETAGTLEDAGHAPALYERMLPYADRVAISYPEISTGAFARNLGLLATLMERWEDAEGHFEAATELNERVGAVTWLARTREAQAEMRRRRDAAGA